MFSPRHLARHKCCWLVLVPICWTGNYLQLSFLRILLILLIDIGIRVFSCLCCYVCGSWPHIGCQYCVSHKLTCSHCWYKHKEHSTYNCSYGCIIYFHKSSSASKTMSIVQIVTLNITQIDVLKVINISKDQKDIKRKQLRQLYCKLVLQLQKRNNFCAIPIKVQFVEL